MAPARPLDTNHRYDAEIVDEMLRKIQEDIPELCAAYPKLIKYAQESGSIRNEVARVIMDQLQYLLQTPANRQNRTSGANRTVYAANCATELCNGTAIFCTRTDVKRICGLRKDYDPQKRDRD